MKTNLLDAALDKAILYAHACEDECSLLEKEYRNAESDCEDAWIAVDKYKSVYSQEEWVEKMRGR